MSDVYFDNTVDFATKGQETLIAILNLISGVSQTVETGIKEATRRKGSLGMLSRHVKKGGKLMSHDVDLKDAGMFEQLLKAKNIAYVSASTVGVDGQKRVVFLTKDCDASVLESIKNRFAYELKIGLGELSMEDFLQNNEGRKVFSKKGLSEVELEVFKTHAVKEDIQYAVSYNPKSHNYEVFYDERDAMGVEATLKRTAYDLSGYRGDEYRKKLQENLEKRRAFENNVIPSGKKPVFIADRYNPNNFIVVTNEGFSTHSVSKEEITYSNGEKGLMLSDKNSVNFEGTNKKEIMDYVSQLHEPVLLTEEQMSLVTGVKKDGSITLVDGRGALEAFRSLQQHTMSRLDFYEQAKITEFVDPEVKVKSMVNLPDKVVDEINKCVNDNGLKQTAVVGNMVAYSLSDAALIDKAIESSLYGACPLEKRLELKFEHEGRGKLLFDSNSPQVIIDTMAPKFAFVLDKKGFTIVNKSLSEDDPMRENFIARDSKMFKESVLPLIQSMHMPIVLSKEEYELSPDERLDVIKSRLPENQAALAREMVFSYDEKEREDLAANRKIPKPSKRQTIATQKVKEWSTTEHVVDKKYIQQFQNHEFDRKIEKEHAEKKQTANIER